MESAPPPLRSWVRIASWMFVGMGVLIVVGELAGVPRSLDEWLSVAGAAAFALVFLPVARDRVPDDFFERLGGAAALFMLSGNGEVLLSLPRWYVAVPLAWTFFAAVVRLVRYPLGKRMQLLLYVAFVGMMSVAFWPNTWPVDATLMRRLEVQGSVAVAIMALAVLLIRRPALLTPAQAPAA